MISNHRSLHSSRPCSVSCGSLSVGVGQMSCRRLLGGGVGTVYCSQEVFMTAAQPLMLLSLSV